MFSRVILLRPNLENIRSFLRITNGKVPQIKQRIPLQCKALAFTPRRQLATAKTPNDKHEHKSKQFTTEFKIFMPSLILGFISWLVSNYFDRQHAKKEIHLELVTQQIEKLYGPLYGNRLVHYNTYRAVVGDSANLTAFLSKVREAKDCDMIRKWRSFAFDVLYPIDKEAANLICKNGHLLSGMHFSEEFENFLAHFARFQFMLEGWKDKTGGIDLTKKLTERDYSESSNATGDEIHSSLLKHVEKEYKHLREKQRRIAVEVMADDSDKLVENLVKKAASLVK